jgi:hypothetical protein
MTAYSLGVVANQGVPIQVTAANPANLNNESPPAVIPLAVPSGSATAGSSNPSAGLVSPPQQSEALSLAPRIVRFSADKTVPTEGLEVNLDWVVSNAQSVAISGTPVSEYGTLTVAPSETTEYTLEVQGKNGTQLTRNIMIYVITEDERDAYFDVFDELEPREYRSGKPMATRVNQRLQRRGHGRGPKEVIDVLFAEYRGRPGHAEDEPLDEGDH